MSDKGRFYVIEGLDGVGKTTVAKNLADALGSEYASMPGKAVEEIDHLFDSDIYSDQSEFLFYLGGASTVSDKVGNMVESGQDVVLDRYFYSPLVYRNAFTGKDNFRLADVFDFEEPDEIFYLEASEKVRKDRIDDRSELDESERNEDFMETVREEYRSAVEEFDMVSIDAEKSPESVVEEVLKKV